MDTTTVYAIPYAEATDDVPTYPALDQDQAEAVEAALLGKLDYTSGPTAPGSPVAYRTRWYDTSVTPPQERYWNGTAWKTLGGAAPVLLDHQTVSGASSIISDGIFTSTFQTYRGLFVGRGSSAEWLRIILRTSGVDNTGASYANNAMLAAIGSSITSSGGSGQTEGWIGRVGSSGTNRTSIEISCPQEAVETTWDTSSVARDSGIYQSHMGGVFAASTQFDGAKIKADAGTLTGDLWWWGIPKA